MQSDIELRKAPASIIDQISSILDINDDWIKFMSCIPKDLRSNRFEPKYNVEHVRKIEEYANSAKLSCARILFDEWGTSGRIRPTLQTVLDILGKTEMIRAADCLTDALKINRLPRPTNGPAAPVDVTGFLEIANTSEQYKETRRLPNGSTKCADPTMKLDAPEPSVQFIQFSTAQDLPDFERLDQHPTTMIPNNVSRNDNTQENLMLFTQEPLPTNEMPDFSNLLAGNDKDNSSVSTMSSGSIAVSESPFPSNTTGNNEISQSSQMSTPPISNVYEEQIDKEILDDPNLISFKYYDDLETITNKFNDTPVGSGGFGDVFKGNHRKHGLLAIKRAHSKQIFKTTEIMRIFNTEVKSLSVLRHKNIVAILGYSLDGVTPCIVCEYIEGGSLLEKIKDKVLSKTQRMNIMIGTAEGLQHIHDTEKPVPGPRLNMSERQYFTHGDVKSANILITKDFVPKLCDLGLSKQCAATFHTESIVGTSAYMAPERFHGTVTPKGDVYSYGIVLLELLTGLQPIVTCPESYNIKNYVEEKCPNDMITEILDPVVGEWPEAERVYDIAKTCTEYKKNLRPTMNKICHELYEISQNAQRVFYADV